jgi:hypothetical protein
LAATSFEPSKKSSACLSGYATGFSPTPLRFAKTLTTEPFFTILLAFLSESDTIPLHSQSLAPLNPVQRINTLFFTIAGGAIVIKGVEGKADLSGSFFTTC